MPIDSVLVGVNERLVVLVGDPTTASNKGSVLAFTTRSLAGLFGQIVQSVPFLLNAAGSIEQQLAAPGAIGIPSVNTEGTKLTYSNGVVAFTPVATATDFWALIGSASKTIRLLNLVITGMATAAASVDIQLLKRSTANTGSTPVDPAIVPHDSNDTAASAIVRTYTASNPTLGTSLGVVRGQRLNLGAAGAAGKIEWSFATRNGKGLVLRGVAQSACLNWGGVAVPAGTVLSIEVEWTEEA